MLHKIYSVPHFEEQNEFGVHHMIGNVWEWTGDKFGRYHDHEPDTDPSGSPRGQDYVKKGGSFLSDVDHSYRKYFKNGTYCASCMVQTVFMRRRF